MNHSGHHGMDHLGGHEMDHSGHHDTGAMNGSGSAAYMASSMLNTSIAAAADIVSNTHKHVHDMVSADPAVTSVGGGDVTVTAHDHSGHRMSAAADPAGPHSAHSMGMSMTFHFGYTEYILFDSWHVTTAWGMVASCIGLFILAVLYEGLKYKREDLLRKNATRSQIETIRVPSDNGVTEVSTAPPQRMLSLHHILQTFLHALQVLLGYFLMLAFMTYNVWVGLAIILGAAVGYFIFGSKKFVVVDVSEHCH